jgi:mycoredoxin
MVSTPRNRLSSWSVVFRDAHHSIGGSGPLKLKQMGIEQDNHRPITVYGTSWCRDCHLAKAVLELYGVSYAWVDIDREPNAIETILRLNGGYRTIPTIVFPDGRVLIEPSRRELEAALGLPAA